MDVVTGGVKVAQIILTVQDLSYWTLNQAGMSVPRLTADGFANYGRSISVKELQVGDLIAFDWDWDKKADHVAIYAGDNFIIHANGNSSIKGILQNIQSKDRI